MSVVHTQLEINAEERSTKMIKRMDFTTTAVCRPGVLDKTLASFDKNLLDINLKDCRMVINIDPLPRKCDRQEVVIVAEKYFGEVKYNMPKVANFTAAYNWVLSNAETNYIFNLEDDWELRRAIKLRDVIKYFKTNKQMLQVLLRAYKYHYRTCALSPGVWNKRFYQAVGGKLRTDLNPEAQLRGERFGIIMPTRALKAIKSKQFVGVYPQHVKQVILRDLGRAWINKTKFRKNGKGKKAHFTTWEGK